MQAGIAELTQGEGDTLLALSDGFAERGSGGVWSNYLEANVVINCMDEQRRTPEQEEQLRAQDITGLPGTLTISITGDPTTPYQGGVSLADSLGGALLTVKGEQHTVAMGGASACVNDFVSDYIVDLETPDEGAACVLE